MVTTTTIVLIILLVISQILIIWFNSNNYEEIKRFLVYYVDARFKASKPKPKNLNQLKTDITYWWLKRKYKSEAKAIKAYAKLILDRDFILYLDMSDLIKPTLEIIINSKGRSYGCVTFEKVFKNKYNRELYNIKNNTFKKDRKKLLIFQSMLITKITDLRLNNGIQNGYYFDTPLSRLNAATKLLNEYNQQLEYYGRFK